MKWEFKNGIPIYLQIIDQIKRQIVSGELAPGSRIPAVRDLAKEAGVNPNTMQRALTQLIHAKDERTIRDTRGRNHETDENAAE